MLRNVAGQTISLFAFVRTTNAPVLDDADNITIYLVQDGDVVGAITLDGPPEQLGFGRYQHLLTKAQTDAETLDVVADTTTPSVQVIGVPGRIVTKEATASGVVVDAPATVGAFPAGALAAVWAVATSTLTAAGSIGKWLLDTIAGVKVKTDLIPADGTSIYYVPVYATLDGVTYGDRAAIDNIYGVENVAKWALLSSLDPASEAGKAESAARIGWALAWATAEIDNHLRTNTRYVLPVTAATAAVTMVNLGATLAGWWLHNNRGTVEFDENGRSIDRYAGHKKAVNDTLAGIQARTIRLDAPQFGDETNNSGPAAQTHHHHHRYGEHHGGPHVP